MTDAATTTERAHTVTIDDLEHSRKKLSFEVPAQVVDDKLAEAMDTLAGEAQLPGFRKGKAPKALLERKLGENLRGEAKNQIVAEAYSQAVEDNKLRVVGNPIAEELAEVEIVAGKPLAFDIEVEVVPEFEMPELDGIEVLRPTFEVTDELVDEEIEKLCINEGSLEERDQAEPGDYLTGVGVMTGSDGTEFYNINGAVVQVPPEDKQGKGMILGVLVEDLAKQLGSPEQGQAITIKVKGPEQHEIEGIRGNDLTISFTVERIDRIIPAKTEDVLHAYGMESADQLNEAVRARLSQRAIIQQQTAMRQQVSQHLIEHVDIDLPERMTNQQAARTLDRRRMELMYRGVSEAEIEEHMAELRTASDEKAQRELKMFFILHQAADDMDIKVEEAEINGRIAQLAMEQGVRPEKLRQQLINSNRVGSIYQQLREHKAMDAILAKADIKDVTADEYAKAMKDKADD